MKGESLYIIRLPWGEESLPSPCTLEGIRADIGQAFIDWKKGESCLEGEKPTFDIFNYKDGKRSKAGSVVFYEDYPVWVSKGKNYVFHRDGTIMGPLEVA